MKFNGKNIIADSDVVMTGPQTGHSLSEILTQHEQDISNLKGNVKWIYKYGGVGSGSGGGGSESSAPWNFRVEIDDVARENGTVINLGQQREYKLAIQLYKVQGRTFTVKYTYSTPQGVKVTEKVIPPTASSLITDIIDLQINGNLSISINDDEGNYDQFILDYIVTAYSFNLDYVYEDNSPYIPSDNNIFVSAVTAKGGLKARFTSIISVDIKSYYIEYQDWNQTVHTLELDPNEKYYYFDLGKDITNDNSGNYQFTVTPHLILKGNNEEEPIDTLKLSDNLIPDTIYLKVDVDGSIYKNTDVTNPATFYSGVIPFFVTGFQGFQDKTSQYSLKVYLNDELQKHDGIVSELQDQKTYELKIQTQSDKLEWNKITFEISRKGDTYTATYYFYTISPLGTFNWYPPKIVKSEHETDPNIYPIKSFQYKYSNPIHSKAQQIPGTNSNLISLTATGASKTLQMTLDYDTYGAKDCLISLGLTYSKLNDVRNPIAMIQGTNSNNNIIIYQNQIQIMGDTYSTFYFPIGDDQYHLIDIYRRAVSSQNNAPLFEFVVYIDGVMELALPGFVSMQETYNIITLYPGLYSVNYLEVSYFNHTPNTQISSDLLEQYNPNPTIYPIDFFTDSSILYHYYSYKLTFYPDSIPEEFKNAYSYVSQFYNNSKTGRIEVNKTLIQQVALNCNVPVLLLTYTEARDNTNPNWTSDGSAFMSWIEKSYDITIDTGATKVGYAVDVAYSKGREELKDINIKDKFQNAYFELFLQGTSTLNYIGKNFDLAVNSSEEDYTYLYSPNFSDRDSSTFLPETRFTIKADVVDSSHSNNNSIGKFINAVTTKFGDAKQSNNKYSNYLKNTLEGFPVLIFIQNSYYINSSVGTTKDDFYFLGISNFNLGREAEFNLGFKDLRLLPESIENGFAVTRIRSDVAIGNENISSKSYLSNLGVMEIRENRNYFDFSQSNPSILFSLNDEDPDYMFSKFKCNNLDILKGNISQFVQDVSKGGGFIFDSLGKNMIGKSESDRFGYGYDEGYKTDKPQNIVPNYRVELKRTLVDSKSVLTPTGKTITGQQSDLVKALLGDDATELDPSVDYTSLSEYYVICMALGLLDSVLKNMNFRKWKNKFYLAFYDMDTSLGKDNAGNNSDYLCFSDYWEPKTSTTGGSTVLEPAASYKDWYDKNIKGGFDIPSSYLFALAKYGYHILRDQQLEDWYPQNLWARFRRSDTQIPGWSLPNNANSNHIGCLKNADAFIDNYFAKHLETVPDVIFNLNYRAKYLQIQKEDRTAYSTDYNKFSGRRIHYVRDWLNSRFHLLDLYFNIAQVSDSILTYDLEKGTWNAIDNAAYARTNSMFVDRSNKDILVIQDAFTSNDSSTKYSSNIDINFTAETHSPLSLSGELIGRYITKENTVDYMLKLDCNGKSVNLGGSGSWLTLSSINTLLQGFKFFANSEKLTTLNGTLGQCSEWSLNLPALKDVSLTSSQYSGVLKFWGKDEWPNLATININKSKLGLNLDNVRVTTINAQEVGPAQELVLINCDQLKSLNINKSIFTYITMTALQDVSYFSTYTYNKDNNGAWKATSTSANSPKCKYLSLTRPNKDGVIFIDNQTYTNNGVTEGLTTVTLSGYKEIYIDNCPYLNKIDIKDPETVEILHVTNSSSLASSLQINSESVVQTINLEKFSNLKEVNFNNAKNFKFAFLPNRAAGKGVQLVNKAFLQTSIQYLSGSNIKLSSQVFQHCGSFTLLQNDGTTLCSFDNTQNVSDLQYTFYGTKVSLATFTEFNNKYRTMLGKVSNTSWMWGYSTCVSYNADTLLEDYNAGTCRFNLNMYTSVTNATGMMGGKSVTACHPDTLKGFGSSSVNMQNFYGWNATQNQEITLPLDWLTQVKSKVTNCNTSDTVIYKVVTYDKTKKQLVPKSEINPKDLFQGNANNKLTTLSNWVFHSDHTINLEGAFLSTLFPKLTKIEKSFVGCKGKNLQYQQTVNENTTVRGFLYTNPNITDISGSFGFTNYDSLTVSLDQYLDWEYLQTNKVQYKGFQYVVNWDEKYNVMLFKKTIGSVELFNNIYNCIISCYKATSLSHLFQNCVITTSGTNIPMLVSGTNTSITSIPYLFSNLQLSSGNSLYWDWDIIKTIPNVIDFRHAFEKNKYRGSIPFNFFQRRRQNTPDKVYIKNDQNQFEQVDLYSFDYDEQNTSNRITNLSYCFYQSSFEIPTYIPGNEMDVTNRTRLQKEGNVLDINTYYTTNSIYSPAQTITNTELDDIGKEVAFADIISEDDALVRTTVGYEPQSYLNYQKEYSQGDLNRAILPTDFFYACSDTVNLTYCFAETNLQGYIPDFMLKNCKNAQLGNFLKGTLVFPKKHDSRYDQQLEFMLHIYYYIGSDFCTTTDLSNAFNFRIHLPGNKTEDSRQLHVFCFTDSFSPNILTIRNALPKDIRPAPEGCFFAVQHLDHASYMNMMYDKASETTTKYNQDENGNDITVDDEGNPIELKPIVGNLGFTLSSFRSLQADGLVNELFSQFTYGNVFDNYTTLESINKNKDAVIRLGGDSTNCFGVSRYAIWPSAKSVKQLIYAGSTVYKCENGTWGKTDTGLGMKIFKTQVSNYSEIVKTYYNNSRTNPTGWAINFIDNE